MNTFLKTMIAIGFAAAVFLTFSFSARAEGCPAGQMNVTELAAKAAEIKGVGGKLAGVELDNLIAKMGPPPGVEGDFDLYRYDIDEVSFLIVVQEGCTVKQFGPMSKQGLDNALGKVNAVVPGAERL